mgnify:FL=1
MKTLENIACLLILSLGVLALIALLTSYRNDYLAEDIELQKIIPGLKGTGEKPQGNSLLFVDETEPEVKFEEWMFTMDHYEEDEVQQTSLPPNLP